MLGRDGLKRRRFRDEFGEDHEVWLQKYYCSCCGERFIEKPDCFESRKLYLKWIIDRVLSGDRAFEMSLQCSPATIYRWKASRKKTNHTCEQNSSESLYDKSITQETEGLS